MLNPLLGNEATCPSRTRRSLTDLSRSLSRGAKIIRALKHVNVKSAAAGILAWSCWSYYNNDPKKNPVRSEPHSLRLAPGAALRRGPPPGYRPQSGVWFDRRSTTDPYADGNVLVRGSGVGHQQDLRALELACQTAALQRPRGRLAFRASSMAPTVAGRLILATDGNRRR
jgi:hypothetical protein